MLTIWSLCFLFGLPSGFLSISALNFLLSSTISFVVFLTTVPSKSKEDLISFSILALSAFLLASALLKLSTLTSGISSLLSEKLY